LSRSSLSIIVIVILTSSLITQAGIFSVNALSNPTAGVKASSQFGTLQVDHNEYDVTFSQETKHLMLSFSETQE
jgi:hypothetical protein